MKNKPKVSIIIPVFNGSNYVKEAIDSALNQTYKNIEVIVVNDGSNDKGKTRKICKKYGERIRYFEKENGGVSSALNYGIRKMKGEYFSWLSHDDRYYPYKIEKQINNLKKYPNNTILYSNYDVMDIDSYVFATSIFDHEELKEKKEYSLLLGKINGLSLLIPKKLFYEISFFDENLKCTQDYDLWLKFIKSGYKFIHMKEVLVTTRLHKNQTTNTSPLMKKEGNELWIKLVEFPTDKRKKELEGSIYDYYKRMFTYLINTPYDKAIKYTEEKMIKLNSSAEKDIQEIYSNYEEEKAKQAKIVLDRKSKYLNALKKGPVYCIKRVVKKIFKK